MLLPTMTRYLALLRGINVGGKNKVPMAGLRELLESLGHANVSTYIASGNVILSSDHSAAAIKRELEEALPRTFKLDSELIAVLVLTRAQLRAVVRKRPKGFGDHPETYHSDAVFLMGIDAPTAMNSPVSGSTSGRWATTKTGMPNGFLPPQRPEASNMFLPTTMAPPRAVISSGWASSPSGLMSGSFS